MVFKSWQSLKSEDWLRCGYPAAVHSPGLPFLYFSFCYRIRSPSIILTVSGSCVFLEKTYSAFIFCDTYKEGMRKIDTACVTQNPFSVTSTVNDVAMDKSGSRS